MRNFQWPSEMPELGFWMDRTKVDRYACVTGDVLEQSAGGWSWIGKPELGHWGLESGDVLRLAYAALMAFYARVGVRHG